MDVLITGGAGYIGSTIGSALLDGGHTPIVLDSLVTGKREFTEGRPFFEGDIADASLVERIFAAHPNIACVIHCAALIVVPESVERPADYYRENVAKSLAFFDCLTRLGCPRLVFSSSASLYDVVEGFEVTEESPLSPSSPYARTKYMMEMILSDICAASDMRGLALRYFNPIGADPKMRSGIHVEAPSHVLGKLVDTALGRHPRFEITGTDWPTRDGTGIRDYVHVWDLARAHVNAVTHFDDAFDRSKAGSYLVINLGTGRGVTVRELVEAFERVWGKPISKGEAPARPGDVAGSYANSDRALELIRWKSELDIDRGISDALKWDEVKKGILS